MLELLYRAINRLRRFLYRAGVLRAKKLPVPVISIGNRAVGGSGKTPATIAIAHALQARGMRVAVLTRGYGRKSDEQGPVTSLDTERFGDEPVLIKSKNIDVIVGSKRYENGSRYSADVFLLDDGFQHLQLHRDCDIVIEAPARFYREGPSSLRDADIVLQRNIRVVNADAFRGKRVFAFSGLANNTQFFDTLRTLGAIVIGTREFDDHHRYTLADLRAIRNAARGADVIVTTEKDAVKIGPADDIMALRIELEIPDGVIEQILEQIGRVSFP
ncbi:MAG TPA: tetraacyldisaccharide 4'-kinase [Thermoanaerobaculia bacterium]|nr:tetraacyldisaccharide 4'-kinase [Thermoanaerobaculia bacterium]